MWQHVGANQGMLIVETIGRVRRDHFVEKKGIKRALRQLRDERCGRARAPPMDYLDNPPPRQTGGQNWRPIRGGKGGSFFDAD